MSTVDGQRPDSTLDASAPLQLVGAAAALRWKRPDLTATLAELALDAAGDAATWVTAAGWLLHGRTALGDGREVACDLLDGLARWNEAGVELMAGPQGRRLRVELAGPARRSGELVHARALLAAEPGVDDLDDALRPDALTELARCAIDDAPKAADDALDAAEQAWLAAGCEPGVASVLLLRAAHHRRAGRTEAAATAAAAGLARVDAGGRRAGGTESDHLAAALTAEWIAALVDARQLDEARGEAVRAAARLVATSRPSRQRAGLRLAVARVTAAEQGADAVLAALEPAAQDAADSDVPDLESACRSMLAELHEAAGRLDDALSDVRAALAAERRDHDRAARLRRRLVTAAATWAGRPSGCGAVRRPQGDASTIREGAEPLDTDGTGSERLDEALDLAAGAVPGGAERPSPGPAPILDGVEPARTRSTNWNGATGPGRRARRLAAESAEVVGWSATALPELGATGSARAAHVGQAAGAPDDVFAAPAPPPDASTGPRRSEPDQQRWGDVQSSTARLGPVSDRDRPSREPVAEARPEATAVSAPTTDTGRSVAVGGSTGGRSLIGDALFRELVENALPRSETSGPNDASSAGKDGRSHDPSHRAVADPPGRPARQEADPALGDTVVFERDPRLGSTVAVPVHPASEGAGGGTTGERPPTHAGSGGRGVGARTRQPSPSTAVGPVSPTVGPPTGIGVESPRSVSETGSKPPVGSTRRPAAVGRNVPVVGDTLRVGAAPGGPQALRNGHRDPTASNPGDGGAADAPELRGPGSRTPKPGETGSRVRAGRPRSTDGPGLGDLLADALAAYRSI